MKANKQELKYLLQNLNDNEDRYVAYYTAAFYLFYCGGVIIMEAAHGSYYAALFQQDGTVKVTEVNYPSSLKVEEYYMGMPQFQHEFLHSNSVGFFLEEVPVSVLKELESDVRKAIKKAIKNVKK